MGKLRRHGGGGRAELLAMISDTLSPADDLGSEVVSELSMKGYNNGGGYFQTELISSSKSACRRGSGSMQQLIIPASSTFTAPMIAEK